jgi:hypothetical protein
MPVLELLLEGRAIRGTLRWAFAAELDRVGRSMTMGEIVGITSNALKSEGVQALGWELGNYIGCQVEKGAPKPPPENFTQILIPAGTIVESCE